MKYTTQSGIYSITHIETGRRYVGSAKNIRNRLGQHRARLRGGKHFCRHLQNAWNKYGEAAFRMEVLETALNSHVILLAREQHWLDHFAGKLFNVRLIAESTEGCKLDLTEEERSKRRDSLNRHRHLKPKRTSNTLSEGDIPAVFARYAAGETHVAIAASYGVFKSCIMDIIGRRTWQDVAIEPDIEDRCRQRYGKMGRKFEDADIEATKRRIAAGEPLASIALDYGVSPNAIRLIAIGEHYAHVRLDADTEAAIALRVQAMRGKRKVTQEIADAIRSRIAAGEKQAALAREYGITPSIVCNINKGRCFARAH